MELEVTDVAITKLIEKKVDKVRLGITGGGCSGYEYVFVEDEFKEGDLEIDYGKFKFLIDTTSQPFLNGLTLDYTKDGLQESFTFQNPNEEASCGCGVSITFNEDIVSKS